MWLIEMLHVAFSAMAQNKLRAFLTMLGVIIGVFSVVAMLGLAEGARQRINKGIDALAESDLTIDPGPSFYSSRGDRDVLTWDDYLAVRDGCPNVRSVVPSYQGGSAGGVQFRDKNEFVGVVATTADYFDLMHLTVATGRPFTASDGEYSRRVCVIGANTATRLAAGPRTIGEFVHLSTGFFQVVGILEPHGRAGYVAVDDCILVPIQTSRDQYQGKLRVSTLNIRLWDNTRMLEAATDIARVLRRTKRLPPGEPNTFNITPTLAWATRAEEIKKVLTGLLAGIGSISLIVGGIGVMNIMLASVSERTREIGTRKSLGATRLAILVQFSIEAIVLCVTGGGLGILTGYGIARIISAKAGWSLVVTPTSVAIALGVSIGVGLFFGIWPAWRAARLDPVEALRYE